MLAQDRQIGHEPWVLHDPATERIADCQVARSHGLEQARDTDQGLLAQLQWVAPGVLDPPQQGVDSVQAPEGTQPQGAIAYRQVATLD